MLNRVPRERALQVRCDLANELKILKAAGVFRHDGQAARYPQVAGPMQAGFVQEVSHQGFHQSVHQLQVLHAREAVEKLWRSLEFFRPRRGRSLVQNREVVSGNLRGLVKSPLVHGLLDVVEKTIKVLRREPLQAHELRLLLLFRQGEPHHLPPDAVVDFRG